SKHGSSPSSEILFGLQTPPSGLPVREVVRAGSELQSFKLLDACSVQINGNGDAIAGIPSVAQVIAVARVEDIHIIIVVSDAQHLADPWLCSANRNSRVSRLSLLSMCRCVCAGESEIAQKCSAATTPRQ